ncbi:rRNA methyltransferase 1, mitochondrial [Dermochelys coriacea]|uniref:rRNA methyltransferase 1, mitochondrial n=1 Tax=Dermochelys coriacea TaxID=27794 RepID=UPI0018E889DE|nr:rRNA methyltransferase 1, mitochondrial [Dermochelys coriacea]XP_038231764.1 rRNA methyltransferase 1, mitochondrial [Dermochelys coriacea]XP_038231766.1 rRNA methyltransferase 1, mitochondrial [Dermochelys coriacea]XP_038231769.1 rRNA methyltransferase 1, mitochondrial [Dermochelys coriacea]XP_038231770.1 rRNA methyltransferase 1, mitochondrial [Dermochelys coriacea]XP_043355347.1 rRNA methyltransferase 1, mitochondrial [Dermochelys coriacea]
MAFVVEMVPIFKFSIWRAARVSFAFSCNSHFLAVKHFSTQEKEPSQSPSPPGFGNEENSHHHGSHHLPMSGLGDAARVIPKSHPPHKSYKGLAPQKNLRWQWKSNMRSTEQAASSNEEFRNLREDDFSKERKRPVPKPTSIERTKGSEILFGIAPCSLALSQSKRVFFKLFLKSGSSCARPVMEEFAQRAKACGVPVHHVRRQVLDALCKGQVHQGVCLEATPLHFRSLEEAEASHVGVATGLGTQLIWLVLEQIQDPMNLGAVLRSAHFLGVDRVVTSQKDSCPLTPTVSKASAGAVEVLEVYSTDNLQRFLKAKTEEGWEVIGTVIKSEVEDKVPVISCLEFHWNKPTLLVLGNEGYGLSSVTQSLCHRMLIIPPGRTLQPGIESLNVSVATGILLHSICSQKIK